MKKAITFLLSVIGFAVVVFIVIGFAGKGKQKPQAKSPDEPGYFAFGEHFSVMIDGESYQLPITVGEMTARGWKSNDSLDGLKLKPKEGFCSYFERGEGENCEQLYFTVMRPKKGGYDGTASTLIVTDLSFQKTGANTTVNTSNGIVLHASTLEDVVRVFGDYDSNQSSDAEEGMDASVFYSDVDYDYSLRIYYNADGVVSDLAWGWTQW